MPAIQLANLKKQVAGLADLFNDPAAFSSALYEILDTYADRIRRHGQAGEPASLMTAHNVPTPVLRHIVKELSVYVAKFPESGLKLCDYLWEQSYLEENLLAAYLLDFIQQENPEPVLERVHRWLAAKPGERLVKAILNNSLATIRQSSPELVVAAIEKWIADPDPYQNQLGLKTMICLVEQPGFDNLAVIFYFVNPFIRSSPPGTQADVIGVLHALARRTPNETAYNLRMVLESSENNAASWYIRQTIKFFPTDIQLKLRVALHDYRDRPE